MVGVEQGRTQPRATQGWLHRHTLAVYVALTFTITWLCWIPPLVIARRQGYLLPTIDNFVALAEAGYSGPRHRLIAWIFRLGVYGPLVGALVATALEDGGAGLRDLARRTAQWRVSLRWYGAALVIALALALVPAAVGALTGVAPWRLADLAAMAPYLLPVLLVQLLTSGLGEEPGWRGYLWPKLRVQVGRKSALWRLGLIWAIWHYPVTVAFAVAGAGPAPVPALVVTVAVSLAGQTLSLIGMTHIYAWLYDRTASVFLAIVFHALSNVMGVVFAAASHPTLALLTGLMPWVVVFVLEQFPAQ